MRRAERAPRPQPYRIIDPRVQLIDGLIAQIEQLKPPGHIVGALVVGALYIEGQQGENAGTWQFLVQRAPGLETSLKAIAEDAAECLATTIPCPVHSLEGNGEDKS